MSMLALSACVLFIIWLFASDRKLRPMASWALWIPFLWVMFIGSRSSTNWASQEMNPEQLYANALEGSPVDRNIFLILIIAGAIALWRRRLNWSRILASNPWLFAFVLYCGLSLAWSDYSFVCLKKWIKELGNVIMILLIVTEENPGAAFRAVFARYVNVAVPLSALLVTFFTNLGSYVVRSEIAYCGIAKHKNGLGAIMAISGIFLAWELVGMRPGERSKTDMAVRTVLFAMVVWLLLKASSATALVCMALGIAVLLCMRVPLFRRQVQHLGTYSLTTGLLIYILVSYPIITDTFFKLVGREPTFTGRTYIWAGLLKEHVNPFLGTGFQSFWLKPGMMERYDFINEAHNGYLEIYLNCGLIGLFLLVAAIVLTGYKLKQEVLHGNSFATLLFSFLVVIVFYNLTEAVFGRLNLTWFVFLVAALAYPWRAAPVPETVPSLKPNGGRVKFSPALSRVEE